MNRPEASVHNTSVVPKAGVSTTGKTYPIAQEATSKTELKKARWQLDLRPILRRLYAEDPVTVKLCSRPLPLSASFLRMLAAATWSWLSREVACRYVTPRRPVAVAIEITNTCNLRCQMCNIVRMERPGRLMRMEVFKAVVDRCAQAGVTSVRLHTYGETLIHPHLEDMIRYAKGRGLSVWISTNGQLLDEVRARSLLNTGVDMVRFSVDGFSRGTYETIRLRGRWDRLIDNMRRFRQLRDELGLRVRIGIHTVLMKETLEEIDSADSVISDYADEISVSPLEGLGEHGMDLAQEHWIEQVDLSSRVPCLLLWEMMNVSVDGKALLCCADVEAANVVGDVLEQELLDIWKGKELTRLRRAHREGRFDTAAICTRCTFGVTNTTKNRFRYALLSDKTSSQRFRIR